MRFRPPATLLALGLVAGCGPGPTDPAEPVRPSFAPGGGTPPPQVRLSFADSIDVGTAGTPSWVPAGYRGDGRLRDGTPGNVVVSNEYQGSFCGTNANVGTGSGSQTTQFTFDPDQFWSSGLPASCLPARSILIHLNGPGAPPGSSRQHRYFPDLGAMTLGQTLLRAWGDGTAAELGVNLWFDSAYPPASSLRWTRLPNLIDELGRSVRRWRIETQGTHRAMGAVRTCIGKKCSQAPTGNTYYLPFSITITEVPAPYPTFP